MKRRDAWECDLCGEVATDEELYNNYGYCPHCGTLLCNEYAQDDI